MAESFDELESSIGVPADLLQRAAAVRFSCTASKSGAGAGGDSDAPRLERALAAAAAAACGGPR